MDACDSYPIEQLLYSLIVSDLRIRGLYILQLQFTLYT